MIHLYRVAHVRDGVGAPFGFLYADHVRAAKIVAGRSSWVVRSEAYDREHPPQRGDFFDAIEYRKFLEVR